MENNEIFKNKKCIISAIECLEETLNKKSVAQTPLGAQNPQKGYEITGIMITDRFIRFSVCMYDRMIREKDDCTRNGDTADYVYLNGVVIEQ